jgi:hypothetical protein
VIFNGSTLKLAAQANQQIWAGETAVALYEHPRTPQTFSFERDPGASPIQFAYWAVLPYLPEKNIAACNLILICSFPFTNRLYKSNWLACVGRNKRSALRRMGIDEIGIGSCVGGAKPAGVTQGS